MPILVMMNNVTASNAFDLLSAADQSAVADYVALVDKLAKLQGVRIADIAQKPIPPEIVARSRGLFLKPLVMAAIAQRLQELADLQDMAPSRVIREHGYLAFSNMADYVEVGQFGEINLNLKKCTREQMAAIKSVKITDTPTGRKTEITLYDKQPSLLALQNIMDMPQIAEPLRTGGTPHLENGADAESQYSKLLEMMRN